MKCFHSNSLTALDAAIEGKAVNQEYGEGSFVRDAAFVAATIIMEEFCQPCPDGIGQAVHDRLREIVEAAIESAIIGYRQKLNQPSCN